MFESYSIVPKFKFRQPRQNLPKKYSSKNTERNFAIKFSSFYTQEYKRLNPSSFKCKVAASREIPINGFGISDLVTISWGKVKIKNVKVRTAQDFVLKYQPTIRSFEIKIRDWRKALIQANRYKYFSHASIVVLPIENIAPALKYLETFKKSGIGVWSFDSEKNIIKKIYTPRPKNPSSQKYVLEAIELVQKVSKALPYS